jgi:hypothetical protein
MSEFPMIYALYPTKPLEAWEKAKELRRKLVRKALEVLQKEIESDKVFEI